ncbi:MAG: hypothetical protein IKW37_01400 [Bacteroidaceae bacterium]|nr:hypothetical protein [Bacteroidaceae bacterium]
MEQLKKCPICGGEIKIYNWRHRPINVPSELEIADIYNAECNDCGFSFVLSKRPLKEFIERLNTRKPMERIVERLEEAESYSCSPQFSKAIDRAIGIVKEEMEV